jgi:hypothetical protein
MKYDLIPTWQDTALELVKKGHISDAILFVKAQTGMSKNAANHYVGGLHAAYKIMSRQIQDLEDYAERLSGQTVYAVVKYTRYEGNEPLSIWSDKTLAEEAGEHARFECEEDQSINVVEYELNHE